MIKLDNATLIDYLVYIQFVIVFLARLSSIIVQNNAYITILLIDLPLPRPKTIVRLLS